jgi:hypothetical protein
MATTPQNSQQDQEDFASGFADEQVRAPEMSEDEVFGLMPEEEPEMGEDEPMPPEAAASDAETAAMGMAGDDTGEPSVTIAPDAAEDGSVSSDEPMSEKDMQRAKSWEGRLKAREAEIKAREDAMSNHMSEMTENESPAEKAAEPAVAEALEEAAEAVESGEMTADEALANLSNDFGEDFTKMLSLLISAKASEIAGMTADDRMSKVSQRMDGMIGEISDDKARTHFESISEEHPDFMDIADSPEFKAYIDGMDDVGQVAALKTIETGSARSINKLLAIYKASSAPVVPDEEPVEAVTTDPAQEGAIDAAEGVRSSGLKLPARPEVADDYASAWDQF